MKYINNQRGDAVLAVVSVIAVIAIGAAGYFAYQNYTNHTAKASTATPTVSPLPVAGLNVFTSSVDKLRLSYPSSWTSTIKKDTSIPNTVLESGDLITSSSLRLSVNDPVDGLGGTCPDPCEVYTTNLVTPKKVDVGNGKAVYRVIQSVVDKTDKTVIRRIGLVESSSYYNPVPMTAFKGYPPYLTFTSTAKSQYNADNLDMIIFQSGQTDEAGHKLSPSIDSLSDAQFASNADILAIAKVLDTAHF